MTLRMYDSVSQKEKEKEARFNASLSLTALIQSEYACSTMHSLQIRNISEQLHNALVYRIHDTIPFRIIVISYRL